MLSGHNQVMNRQGRQVHQAVTPILALVSVRTPVELEMIDEQVWVLPRSHFARLGGTFLPKISA
jgi:hypothetical protein